MLYVLAAAVAFVAVLGAWYLAARWIGGEPAPERSGYLVAIELTADGEDDPVAALLVVQDPVGSDPAVHLVPPDLLLEGPNGEYVFAGDAMTAGNLREDLSRVVRAPIDAVHRLPVVSLGKWSGADQLQVTLEQPVAIDLETGSRVVEDGDMVATADLPAVFTATGADREDVVDLQVALVESALEAAALRAAGGSSPPPESPGAASPETGLGLAAVVDRITAGAASVTRFPSWTRVAEGQFAFVPDPEGVMAEITRRAPEYEADVTVQVRNGSGRVGVGEAAVQLLSSLDVNLPAPLNADSFSYERTQILAGPETLPVAREVRAILGRGVVLDGAELPPATVEVILGADFKAAQPTSKDQP